MDILNKYFDKVIFIEILAGKLKYRIDYFYTIEKIQLKNGTVSSSS
jgi:hypothetical protein